MTTASTRRIVVGVDGSPGSRAALKWATDNAARLDASVDAVLAYSPIPVLVFAPGGAGALAVAGGEQDLAAAAAAQLAQVVDAAGATGQVQESIVESGHAWQALTDRGVGALMLVVGHHRYRALGAVMGSTARACLQHARCPVLVVPEDSDPDHSGPEGPTT